MNLKQIKEALQSEEQWSQSGIGYHKIEWLIGMLEEAEDFAIWSTGFDPGMSEEMLRQAAELYAKTAREFLKKLRGEK